MKSNIIVCFIFLLMGTMGIGNSNVQKENPTIYFNDSIPIKLNALNKAKKINIDLKKIYNELVVLKSNCIKNICYYELNGLTIFVERDGFVIIDLIKENY